MFSMLEVQNEEQVFEFHQVPNFIYRNDPQYIKPLDKDIEDVFNPETNDAFENGAVKRYILYKLNKPVGRVAVFYRTNNKGIRLGGMGFFECINQHDAAFFLFDKCKEWLMEHGCMYMDGPINFGRRENFWGCLISSNTYPSFRINYNPKYYSELFEAYGFERIIEQSTWELDESSFQSERFGKVASRVFNNPQYSFMQLDYGQMERFSTDFSKIFNAAWANHEDFRPMSQTDVLKQLKKLKGLMPPWFCHFAYANDGPVGFNISMLEVNQAMRDFNGKLNFINALKFLWRKRKIDKLRGIVFGVVPNYQNKGIEAGLLIKCYEAIKNQSRIKTAELTWIGDFNPKMLSMMESMGAHKTKIHYTYRKLF